MLEAAPLLLGAVLAHGEVSLRLTEVEAYAGPDDPGSHAFRRTPRSAIMYGPPGRLYVYLSYGLHHCLNVVCGPEGDAGAVLLRAAEVLRGRPLARERRGDVPDQALARGPACLARAVAISLGENGLDLAAGPVRLVPGPPVSPERIERGPRVGLRRAADRPWRFWIRGEPTVSAYRPAARRPAPPRLGRPQGPC